MTLRLISIFIFGSLSLAAAQTPAYQYVSPKPHSILVSPQTNIILRSGVMIDRSILLPDMVRAQGSVSGVHAGKLVLSDDNRTLVFTPDVPFRGNEIVKVTVRGAGLADYAFDFTTMLELPRPYAGEETDALPQSYDAAAAALLPAPPITIDSSNNPAPGCIFLATWDRNVPQPNYANYIFVLDSTGHILDSVRVNGPASDLKVQPNGLLSYSVGSFSGIVPSGAGWTYMVLDSTLAVVDSFKMKNGYSTDGHEFDLLPNGHALLMSYATVTYDMSTVVPGGRPDASFTICVLQEQDVDKNVVFEWRDIDHIPITDSDIPLTAQAINYTTLNACAMDNDGNLLLSFRNLSTIMKISRSTGEILWRLGGKKGDFTFVGEHAENAPSYFSRQHHILRIPNGHITLFDNGELHTPSYSRAVEYELDEATKVATLVSEYRYPTGNIFSLNGGAALKLPDGGWFMGFGNLAPQSPVKRIVVEAHADGSTALELSVPNNVTTYRIDKKPWKKQIQKPSVTIPEVRQGDSYVFNKGKDSTGVSIAYVQLSADLYNMVTVTRIPYGPTRPEFVENVPRVSPVSIIYEGASIYSQVAELHVNLKFYPEIKHPAQTSILTRAFPGQGLFVDLPTTYDSVAHELIASSTIFGEIIFGEPDVQQTASTPVLIQPANGKSTLAGAPVTMQWTGRGLLNSFRLQIATDTLFTIPVFDTTLTSSFYTATNLLSNQHYYWRILSASSTGPGSWSSAWSFQPREPFMTVLAPNGGEALKQGSAYVIRWETNIADSVRLYLLRGAGAMSAVGKSLGSNSALLWNIPVSTVADSSYKLRIVSYADSALADTSDVQFAITTATGIGGEGERLPLATQLEQNYPNPFNPTTGVRFQVPGGGEPGVDQPASGLAGGRGSGMRVKLAVYDLLGREVAVLVDEQKAPGRYEVTFDGSRLASGVYVYRMTAGSSVQSRTMLLLK